MNERILNLARIAQGNNPADYAPDDNVILLATQDVEKFAELIVKECIRALLEWKREPFPFEPDDAARLLREHFGVEE